MRPDTDQTWLLVAKALSMKGTCPRRQVGCVLIDKNGRVAATGWNGAPSKMDHCIDVPCPGVNFRSGTGHSQCEAIHAEMNALFECADKHNLATCYTTTAPCRDCIKLLIPTSIERIVYLEDYHHSDAMEMWYRSGEKRGIKRLWQKVALWYNIEQLA